MKTKKYDIVFWAYICSVVDRHIPLMVMLNKKGYKTALFYQDFDMLNNRVKAHELLISKHNLDVLCYGDFLKDSIVFKVLTYLLKITKNRYMRNKLRGLRFRLLQGKMTRGFIGNILQTLGHRLNVFDTIRITKETKYPAGSFLIKDISDSMGIKGFATPHGVKAHFKDTPVGKGRDFDKIIVASSDEKENVAVKIKKGGLVIPIGDPRFDTRWKHEVKAVFRDEARKVIHDDELNSKIKILYISPGLEHFGLTSEKYKALSDVAQLAASLGNAKLLIMPHPRYRFEGRITNIMRQNKMTDFVILNNEPLIAYADFIDYVISPVTSTVFDILPEAPEKVLIYDEFSKKENLLNIFKGHLNYFEDFESLKRFIEERSKSGKGVTESFPADKKRMIEEFCNRKVADGKGLDTIIDRYTQFILNEIN